MPPTNPKHIVILGAGIIGLQSALALQNAGYQVTIVAKYFPGDEDPKLYTSPWAGAQWRSHAGPDDKEQQSWDKHTYEQWMLDVKAGKGEEQGLAACLSYLYGASVPSPEAYWWAPYVSSFKVIQSSSFPSAAGIASGVGFTTVTVNVPQHLSYLLRKLGSAGGSFVSASLPTEGDLLSNLQLAEELVRFKGVCHQIHGFVNATGLGARELVPDSKMYPTRGQTLVVKGEAAAVRTLEGTNNIRYVIPRPYSGTSILGGTKQAHNWSTEVDEQTTKEILDGCMALAPELLNADGEFEVLKVNVGLRPSREGGARVEQEHIGGKWVVHAYGNSGAGYQNSVGVARKVVGLVADIMEDGDGRKIQNFNL